MARQYPYVLEVCQQSSPIKDENGDWSKPVEEWVVVGKCRDEVGNGRSILTANGIAEIFSALIQMPKCIPTILVESQIRVIDSEGNTRITGRVINFVRSQMHAQLWV